MPPSEEGCYICPTECLNCSTTAIALKQGYRFSTTRALATQSRDGLRCPIASACPAQILQPQPIDPANESSPRELVLTECTSGFAGMLCAKCANGYKMSVLQTCEPCDTSTTAWSPWLLVPLLLAAMYVALRKFFTFRREKRQEKLGAARRLFAALSSTPSVVASGQAPPTELSKTQMIAGMAKLGLTVPDNVAFDLLDAMDIDHSGSINARNRDLDGARRVSL